MSVAPSKRMLSIVVPVFNERENVPTMLARLTTVMQELDLAWEVIFSVDPCTDGTEETIRALCAEHGHVRMLRMSRRFGQPMATIAGLEASAGDAVVVIDCDLQDPPEVIPALVERWREGYEVVCAQRRTRAGDPLGHRIVAHVAYRVINRIADVEIPIDTGDFRLMSRRVVDNVVALKESHGYLRGLVGLVGFPQALVPYDRESRTRGASKYTRLWGSLYIGFNGVVGFSRYPLQLISVVGVILSMIAFLLSAVYLGLSLGGFPFPLGNPTIVILLSLYSGIQMLSLGVMGEYLGRIYDESRDRPKYIVESTCGWDAEDAPAGEIRAGSSHTESSHAGTSRAGASSPAERSRGSYA
jgi:glycosyltransferase involved in cell wall biosynthesis